MEVEVIKQNNTYFLIDLTSTTPYNLLSGKLEKEVGEYIVRDRSVVKALGYGATERNGTHGQSQRQLTQHRQQLSLHARVWLTQTPFSHRVGVFGVICNRAVIILCHKNKVNSIESYAHVLLPEKYLLGWELYLINYHKSKPANKE